jgi:hypothetical protein
LDPVALHVLVQVRRCDEMERKLRFLEKEIKKDSIPMMETTEPPDAPQPRQDQRFKYPSTSLVLVDPDPHGSALTWVSLMRILIGPIGNADPDSRAMELSKINK